MIDFQAIAEAIFDGAVEALGGGAQDVLARAKARAPVRQIFRADHFEFRPKSIKEVQSDRAAGFIGSPTTWRHELYAPTKTASGFRSALNRRWRQRQLAEAEFQLNAYQDEMAARRAGRSSGRMPQATTLSRRGAWEVKTALASNFSQNPRSARWSQGGRATVGGRLRGEIYATTPHRAGNQAEAWVISPTEYAKFQEFGTRHNRAHPFLRPALDESREDIVSQIAAAIKASSRTGGSQVDLEIVVRL